ncbi:MAG: MFS transporter [Muricauda sp.]|nr:MFS transporter [Allomuricauda sp.]MBO6532511.1 MFS transporter [Allomuricauda sp.]MBO6588171.1 MFS transporter [Allomuricauda sp.]MBO6617796.1 MFS transporter [Allomuricauda sp.]MBO6643193.1 MFS transporter [Allomuricauda sp.]MBO6746131.1 MFS transporter [Allomuricauda sp.]
MKNVNKNQLFIAACISLVVTSMTFAIRAGILTQLGEEFELSNQQLGWINSMAFFGFPIAMIFGGLLYNKVGARKLMVAAFVCHLLGLVLTIVAGGFWTLIISTFFIGFANGSVEAACNPMIADMYTKNRTAMLNKFHVWFPGGIVIGSLISKFMTDFGMGWQLQIGVMLIPTFIYGYMFFKQQFPESEHIETDTTKNIKGLADPLFIFILICMTLTAISEFGPQQWVERILGNSGASPMLVLAMVTGIMAIGRYFAGPIVHRINPIGVLLMSAVVTTAAVYSMSIAEGSMIYLAAILFALGVCYFWPTMIGFTSEYLPKTGALGMSLVGGAGMFATSIWQPVIGGWLDTAKNEALASGLADQVAELTAGKATLGKMMFFPLAVAVLFFILFLLRKKLEERRVPQGHTTEEIV